MAADHFVAGFEIVPSENIQFTLEGFYKNYSQYPFSVRDSVPLSSKSADYGIFGDEALVSTSNGRAYGFEILGRLKEFKKINLVFSYTFVRSEFRGSEFGMIPSSWDNKHLFNLTATKNLTVTGILGLNGDLSAELHIPHTIMKNLRIKLHGIFRDRAILIIRDLIHYGLRLFISLIYGSINSISFRNWSLMLYADVQNVYNHKADQPPFLSVKQTAMVILLLILRSA